MKRFDDFQLDMLNECLWRNGVQISLPPKPFAVLRYLVEHPGRLITHDELLEALWPETYVQPQVLRTYVLELRKLLGDDAAQPRFIQTLPKRGYSFVASVEEVAGKSSVPQPADREPEVRRILGRAEELSALMALLDGLSTGQRRVVFVTGEAGIGKTAIVEAFCESLSSSHQMSVARGQCVDGFGAKEEYYPLMEALSELCASPDGERASRVLARIAPAWLSASGRMAEIQRPATVPSAQHRLPGDLCAALEELAAEKPLLLILEDLQWADPSTLHLVSALARRRGTAKLMALATYRPQDASTEQPLKELKQDLLMRKLCVEIRLRPLARTAIRELLRKELQQEELPLGLATFVHQHAEGNPLFAIAILEHLIAQRFLVREQSDGVHCWKQRAPFQEMEAGVPDGLAQMIELEISRLTPQEQRLLEAGSLMNVAFPAWMVAIALKEDVAETEEACDDLARRLYFVERGGQDELPDGTRTSFYVFAHGLYREVLYQRQSSTRRAHRHTRVAERLGQLFSGLEANVAREIAFHYEAAGSWQSAVTALRSAAQHAQQRKAHAEAANLLEHAFRLVDNLGEMERGAAQMEISNDLMLVRDASMNASASGLSRKA